MQIAPLGMSPLLRLGWQRCGRFAHWNRVLQWRRRTQRGRRVWYLGRRRHGCLGHRHIGLDYWRVHVDLLKPWDKNVHTSFHVCGCAICALSHNRHAAGTQSGALTPIIAIGYAAVTDPQVLATHFYFWQGKLEVRVRLQWAVQPIG